MSEESAREITARFDDALVLRGTLDAHCEEIAKRVWPGYSGSFVARGVARIEGEKRTEDMVDSTAALALQKFGAVLESLQIPRNALWQLIRPADKVLRRNRSVRMYFDDVTDILFRHRRGHQANFHGQKQEQYLQLGAFGTGPLFVDRLRLPWDKNAKGLRYKSVHLGEVFFLENHQGLIDTAFRKFELTARQAGQKFGEDKLHEKIRECLKDGKKGETKFWFIHCVKPRTDYDSGRADFKGMPFVDEYVDVAHKHTVQEGGFTTFPYSIPRYTQAPGELYGRSPAMMALPAIKVLNEEKRTILKQGHRSVDPVLLTHDDGVVDDLMPGAVNPGAVTADGKLLVHTLPVGNIAIGKDLMDDERFVINDAFLVTMFQVLLEHPNMTATQVLELAQQKGMLLGPMVGRMTTEDLGPMTDRELDLLAQQGLLPPMPPMLRDAQGEYELEYDNPLARAQKAESVGGTMRTIQFAAEIAKNTGDPAAMDLFDWDAIMPDVADGNAMPARHFASPEVIAQRREARAQAAQASQVAEVLPAAAGMMKAMPPQ
jgi:hypothetical protein